MFVVVARVGFVVVGVGVGLVDFFFLCCGGGGGSGCCGYDGGRG